MRNQTTRWARFCLLLVLCIFAACLYGRHLQGRTCIVDGCHSERVEGRIYCREHIPKNWGQSGQKEEKTEASSDIHKEQTPRHSYGKVTRYSYRDKYKKSNHYTGQTGKSDGLDAYDKGYEDISEDGDYDEDRYERDSDYADGVDDAMDEDDDW